MPNEGISTKVSVLGDKEYKQAMGDIGRQLTVLNTEMAASESAFGKQANSMEALQKKGGGLEKILEAQAEKVRLVSEQLNKAKDEYGENSKQADNLQIALNRAQTAFNKTANEIEKNETAMQELSAAEEKASTSTDDLAGSAQDAAKGIDKEGDAANAAEKDNTKLKDALQKTGDVAKGALVAGLKAAAAAVAALGTAAIGAAGTLGKEVIKSFGELEQNLGGSEAVFGKYAAQIQKSGEDAYKNLGASQSDYLATANKMGALFQGSGIEQRRSLELTEKSMQRAADMASVMGIDTQVALDSIAGAAKGNFTMMDNLGVAMNATTIEAYALAKGLDFTWASATNAEKAEVAMQMFFEQTEQYAGNFAKESTQTVTGSIGLMRAALSSFTAGLGNSNADMTKLTGNLVDAFQAVVANVVPIIENLVAALPEAFDTIANSMDDVLPVVMKAINALVNSIVKKLPGMVSTLLPAAASLLQSVLDGITSNAKPLAEMASSLISSLVQFLIQNASGMVDAAASLITGLIDGLLSGDGLAKLVSGAIEMLAKLAVSLVENAFVLAAKAPEIIGQLIKGILSTDWLTIGKSLLTGLAGGISSAFSDANKLAAAYKEQFGETQAAYDAFKESLEKADLNFDTAVKDAEGKKALASELLELYNALESKEIKTDADLTLMATYAKQIAELYPSLGEYIDPATGLFAENTTAIQDNINAMAQLALVQGYQGYLNELGTALAQANIEILKGTESLKAQYDEWWRLSGIKDDVADLYKTIYENPESDGGLVAFEENLAAVYNTIKEHADIENPLAGFVDVLADGTVVLREGADAAAAYDAAQTQLTLAVTSANDEFSALNGVYLENKTALEGMQTEAAATSEEMGNIAGFITKGTEAFNAMAPAAQNAGAAGKQAGDDLEAGGDAALTGAEKFQDASTLMEGADTTAGEVAESVNAAGDDVATAAGEILTNVESIQGAQTAAEAAKTATVEAMESVSEASAAMLAEMQTISETIVLTAKAMLEAIETAITTGTNEVAKAGKTMATKVVEAVSKEMTPAKGTTIGKDFTVGVGKGITNNSSTVSHAAKGLATSALSALRSAVGTNGSNFESIGTAIANGVAAGIKKGSSTISAAAKTAAKAAYDAAKKELGIASPSRRMMEIGEFYDEGFASGIISGMDKVLASARTLSDMAAAETAGGISYPSMAQPQFDYHQLGEAVAAANERAGIGKAQIIMDKRIVGETVEPTVSRATYQRAGRSVAGRSARMAMV